MTGAKHKSDFEITKDSPYLALAGEIWVFFAMILEMIDRFITALHSEYNMFLLNTCILTVIIDVAHPRQYTQTEMSLYFDEKVLKISLRWRQFRFDVNSLSS